MVHCKQSIALGLVLGTIWLSGCDDSHARSAPSGSSSSASAQASAPSAAKHSPRDSVLATYSNPTYGASFRYPRNYLLEEEIEPDDSSTLWTQQDFRQRASSARREFFRERGNVPLFCGICEFRLARCRRNNLSFRHCHAVE